MSEQYQHILRWCICGSHLGSPDEFSDSFSFSVCQARNCSFVLFVVAFLSIEINRLSYRPVNAPLHSLNRGRGLSLVSSSGSGIRFLSFTLDLIVVFSRISFNVCICWHLLFILRVLDWRFSGCCSWLVGCSPLFNQFGFLPSTADKVKYLPRNFHPTQHSTHVKCPQLTSPL